MIRYFIMLVVSLVFSCNKVYSEYNRVSVLSKLGGNLYREKIIFKNEKRSQDNINISLKNCRSDKIDLKERLENKILHKGYFSWMKDSRGLKNGAPKAEIQLISDTKRMQEEIRDFETQERMAQSMISDFVMQQREKVRVNRRR